MTQAPRDSDLLLIKAAQVWPFYDTVARHGGPVASLCRKAGLPLDAVRDKRGVVGEHSAWRFVQYAAEHLGLDHLGYLSAVEHPIDSTGELGGLRMRMAPTLGKSLEFFIEDIRAEDTGAPYRLRHDCELTWFRRELIFPGSGASWQTEQYVIMVIIQIVRICAGKPWLPRNLRIASSDRPRLVPDEWSGIDIEWGHDATEIAIENHVMALASPEAFRELNKQHHRSSDSDLTALDIEYIVDRQIWSGATRIDDAASELGLSVTTLKRRLRQNEKTYSGVVSKRRQYWAEQLLATTSTSVRDIARTLGYRHHSNFARAFARQTGMSPVAFRKRSLEPGK